MSVRAGEPDRGAASRLLTTLAIVRANADANQDYISNFEPFATDCLRKWPAGRTVEPETLTAAICKDWGVPSLPRAVGKILLGRAEQRGEVTRARGGLHPNSEMLADVPSLAGEKEEMLAGMDALARAVVRYANDVYGLDWSTANATDALERLAEEFGAELAVAKQKGGLAQTDLADDEALGVVHGFARRAIESDPANFKYLEELVQGSMLVNAMYFPDVGHVSGKLKQLRVYLDTTPILRALDLAAEPVVAATHEMLSLLGECKVRMFVFPHTLTEIEGVLERMASALRRGPASPAMQEASGRNRETIDVLVRRGATAGEVEALNAELETRLRQLGISPVDAPSHPGRGHVDEERLYSVLGEVVRYRSKGTRKKDLESLVAVDRLRGKTRPRDLSQANAIFVTANTRLARASRRFFEEEGRKAPVPHAMHEMAFTAQLWIRAPHPRPDLPGKLLIADCYAALNPTSELWERWRRHIRKLQEDDGISQEQVQNLIYHQLARSMLLEVTQGNPNAIGDDTVVEVLDRFEADIRKPATEAAKAELRRRKEVEAERDALHHELEALRRLEAGPARRWRRGIERGRTAAGYGLVAAVVLPFLVAGFGLGEVSAVTTAVRAWGTLKRGR